MSGIIEYFVANPKEIFTAGNHAISLIEKLKGLSHRDASINALLIEIEKGCFETSTELRQEIYSFRDYCSANVIDTSLSLPESVRSTSWLRPNVKLALKYRNAKLTGLKQRFGQFVEDATAILLCFEKHNDITESSENEIYSELVARRNDFEGLIKLDQPLGHLLDNLVIFSDQLHSRFRQG